MPFCSRIVAGTVNFVLKNCIIRKLAMPFWRHVFVWKPNASEAFHKCVFEVYFFYVVVVYHKKVNKCQKS